jgi:hypothetical protein
MNRAGYFSQITRDIWSHGSGEQLRELLSSSLATLLFTGIDDRPAYFSSPWISDFILFDNRYKEFGALFPEFSDRIEIRFSDYLLQLCKRMQVRLMTTRTEASQVFLRNLEAQGSSRILYRYAPDEYHEKGILAPSFFIEGSMNITYSGVYVRGEKISYTTTGNAEGANKIGRAYLEYGRRWEILK